jgi:predicted dehydrogenase
MKVLIAGWGSIGRKHAESLARISPSVELSVLRSGKSNDSDLDSLKDLKVVPKFFYGQLPPGDIQWDGVWICTPTANHFESLLALSDKKPALIYLEKPIASQGSDLEKISKLLSKTHFFYGCILRFHPVYLRISKYLAGSLFGRPISYRCFSGSYLPDWRTPKSNVTENHHLKSYSAHENQGGGVHLDLIHEFDYLQGWFGDYSSFSGGRYRLGNVTVDSSDCCRVNTKHDSDVTGTVELTYLRPQPRRDIEIQFERGRIRADFIQSRVDSIDSQGQTRVDQLERVSQHDLLDRANRLALQVILGREKNPWDLNSALKVNQLVVELPRR